MQLLTGRRLAASTVCSTGPADLRRRYPRGGASATAAAHPDAVAPELARALNNRSLRLADLGRREEALTAITEAVDVFRRLAAEHAVFVADVAGSLVLQGLHHAESGDFGHAISADREAVSVYTALASADPDRYRERYEQAIHSLAQHLKGLGCTEQQIADELNRVAPEGGREQRESAS